MGDDWTSGYVADISYTYGYYQELNPLRVGFAFLSAGLLPPKIHTACELGFGQGLSVNIHAAGSNIEWYGTDFNPAQAAFAQELTSISGSDAKLYDVSFEEFAHRPDLPDFDYIGIHGIWSWISAANRDVLVDFIRRRLKVGGVLYISYNTLPGWSTFAPLRGLLLDYIETLSVPGNGLLHRIGNALDFSDKLFATNPLYSRANPFMKERIENIKTQNLHYLAHEYFNRDWHPMLFADMACSLEAAKLNYACSATLLEHLDTINLTDEQQAFLRKIPDLRFRESARDFMVNQQFRRDYWIKGRRQIDQVALREALGAQRVLLASPRDKISLKITGALGEATMKDSVYEPILDHLADHKVYRLDELFLAVQNNNLTFNQVAQAILLLLGAGHVSIAQDATLVPKAQKRTEKLNTKLLQLARGGGAIAHLASPVTAGGVPVDRIQQLFLLAGRNGRKQPEDWAAFVWEILASQGHHLRDGAKELETATENMERLSTLAQQFADKQLPVLQALQVV